MSPSDEIPFEETLTEQQRANMIQGKQHKSTADQAYKDGKYKNGAFTSSWISLPNL